MKDRSDIMDFPAPRGKRIDLLFIAGEHSGDEHAARLVQDVLARKPDLEVAALGGENLSRAGAQILFDLPQFSVVGFFEVLQHYPVFKKVFEKTVEWIVENKPAMICLVDYPGFNLRLADRLASMGISRRGGGDLKVFYYISPQIWAWKAKRRFQMSRILDSLGVIFPFEVDCFSDTDLETRFVGHPFVDDRFKPLVDFDPGGPVLLFPGSRSQAVGRIFPALIQAFALFAKEHETERAVIVYPSEAIRKDLVSTLDQHPALAGRIDLVKAGTPVSGRAVLTSSGTMSLACALAGIPGAIAYRAHPVTYFLGRRLIKIQYLGIGNLLLNREIYPEYIQSEATAENLFRELQSAISSEEKIEASCEAAKALRSLLRASQTHPASSWILDGLSGR